MPVSARVSCGLKFLARPPKVMGRIDPKFRLSQLLLHGHLVEEGFTELYNDRPSVRLAPLTCRHMRCQNKCFLTIMALRRSLPWRPVMMIEPLVALVVAGFLAFVLPMRCQGPMARPPLRGCRVTVYGFLDRCRKREDRPAITMDAARRSCRHCRADPKQATPCYR
jgi:hypothetical protein